ncbi:MAG: hypothetical protein ACKV2T_42790 [Kofleriaceae bacterium]
MLPGIGNAMSAAEVPYYLGSGGYDAATGDRDGAVDRVAHAAVSGISTLPVANELIGGLDLAGGILQATTRSAMLAGGMEGGEHVPGSVGDLAAMGAVAATNALFGADTTNWIADGNAPQGTRQGEIIAGTTAMGAAATGGLGAVPAGVAGVAITEASQELGVGASDEAGTTTGAGRSPAAEWGLRHRIGGAPTDLPKEHTRKES